MRKTWTRGWRRGAALAVIVGAALAADPARAAPPTGYEKQVARLEEARLDAADTPDRALALGEKLLRLHLVALGPRGTADDPALESASFTIDDLVLDCATIDPDDVGPPPRSKKGARRARIDGSRACLENVALRIQRVLREGLGAADPRRIGLLEGLGTSLVDAGGLDAAIPILDDALTARLAQLGPRAAVDGADALDDHFRALALACDVEAPACHVRLLRPELDRLEKQLGSDDERLADILEEAGETYLGADDDERPSAPLLARAREVLERELAVRERHDAKIGDAASDLPYALVGAYLMQRDFAAIVPIAERAGVRLDDLTSSLLGSGDETLQRKGAGLSVYATDEALTIHLANAPDSAELARFALGAILRRKGRILETQSDLLTAARASADVELTRALTRQTRAKGWLALQATRRRGGQAARRALKLATESAKIADAILRRSKEIAPAPRRASPSIDEVAAALAEGEALVEIMAYRPLDPGMLYLPTPTEQTPGNAVYDGYGAPRYAAYVLRRGGAIAGIDLGEVRALDAAASALRAALGDEKSEPTPAARALDRLTMERLRPLLGGAHRVLISPDGALALVPFGALIDEKGRYLLEDFTFRYLSSGRDAAPAARAPTPRHGPVIVGDPAFDAAPSISSDRGARGADLSGARFPSLPGTLAEARDIAAMFRSADLLLGERASETALKALHGPAVLHLATHGFFAPDPAVVLDARDLATGNNLVDLTKTPMLRAGLALAGANRSHATGSDDGVLTALEASSLDLAGTKLVVLSACETALGDASPGEGVYGLRRALSLAGAETLVMSLWRVPDSATRDLMEGFYGELRAGSAPSAAMRKVALAMLADGRAHPRTSGRAHPRFWAGFIVSGDDVPLRVAWAPPIAPPPAAPGPRGCACSVAAAASPSPAPLLFAAIAVTLRRRRRRADRGASSLAG